MENRLLHGVSQEANPLSQAILTSVKEFVEAQKYLFENLWKSAISARYKIKEIEEGIKPSFIETLRDAFGIQKFVVDLVTSTKQEILMLLFPSTTIGDIFLRGHEDLAQQIIQLLKYAESQQGIRLRILASEDIYTQIVKSIAIQQKTERSQEYAEREEGTGGLVGIRKQKGRFEIHFTDILQQQQQQQRLQTKVSFLIVDSKVSLVEEELKAYNNKNKNNSNQALSVATYSNSESTILAYISIFETFWTQTELKIKMR